MNDEYGRDVRPLKKMKIRKHLVWAVISDINRVQKKVPPPGDFFSRPSQCILLYIVLFVVAEPPPRSYSTQWRPIIIQDKNNDSNKGSCIITSTPRICDIILQYRTFHTKLSLSFVCIRSVSLCLLLVSSFTQNVTSWRMIWVARYAWSTLTTPPGPDYCAPYRDNNQAISPMINICGHTYCLTCW